MTQDKIRLITSDFIRNRRIGLRMSQTEVAKLCGVDQVNISAIERGAIGVNDKMMAKLTIALHFHPADIWQDSKNKGGVKNLRFDA